MGRFATTAELYEQYRPPYSTEFFQAVARKLALSKRHALIDLGTGPGLLALGFAPMPAASWASIPSQTCWLPRGLRPRGRALM